MRSIRKYDTKPELAVRRIVHALGFRFRLHRRDLPGTPDIVLPRHRGVIFVHGCFWHQHSGCRYGKLPRARPDYWHRKLERNVARGEQAILALRRLDWRVLVIWECQLSSLSSVENRVRRFLHIQPSKVT
jgi:DNA mismatch endonuclease (patch repair protein)